MLTKQQKKIQYNLRIDPELHKWLKEIAKDNERPVNYVINQAIKGFRKTIESAKA